MSAGPAPDVPATGAGDDHPAPASAGTALAVRAPFVSDRVEASRAGKEWGEWLTAEALTATAPRPEPAAVLPESPGGRTQGATTAVGTAPDGGAVTLVPEASPHDEPDLLAGGPSPDWTSLAQEIGQFLDRIEGMPAELIASGRWAGLLPWVAAGVSAAVACELARRQERQLFKVAGKSAGTSPRWLPGSAGLLPRGAP